jgi:hypothetical protein
MLFSNCYVDFIHIFTGAIGYTISQPKKKKAHFNVLSVNVQHLLGRTVFSSAMLTWRCFYGRMPFLTPTLVQCCTNDTFRSLLHWLPTVY